MKKKLVAFAVVILVIAMTLSFTACKSKSMFDGKYEIIGHQEQAQAAWDGAQHALNSLHTFAPVLSTDKSQDAELKSWKGMKINMVNELSMMSVDNGVTEKLDSIVEANGAILFDLSSMAIVGKNFYSMAEGEDSKKMTLNAAMYAKDSDLYTSLNLGKTPMNIKFTPDTPDKDVLNSSAIKKAVTSVSSQFVNGAVEEINSLIGGISYEQMLEKYSRLSSYVDNSGKYNRTKFSFSAQMMADFYASQFSFGEDFVKMASITACYFIVVTDKETNAFQGAKLRMSFEYEFKDLNLEGKIVHNLDASVENCPEVKSSMPSDLDSYTDVENLTLKQVKDFLQEIFDLI